MAYVRYNNISNNNIMLGSQASELLGPTGTAAMWTALAAGAAYLGYEYGGAASESLFGSTTTTTVAGSTGTLTTAGRIGTGGFINTVGDWGSALWSGVSSVGSGLYSIGSSISGALLPVAQSVAGVIKTVAPAVIPTTPTTPPATDTTTNNSHASATEAGVAPQFINDIATKFGTTPATVTTVGIIGIGAVILMLTLTGKE